MSTDKLFAGKRRIMTDFNFGKKTTAVFDDMLVRSVPFYAEMQRMISEIVADFSVEGTNLYDLGCSTGNTFLMLDPVAPPGVRQPAAERMGDGAAGGVRRWRGDRDVLLA